MPATTTRDGDTLLLALATLGRATEIEMILSMSQRPRWPRQVQSCVAVTDGFANKRRLCKQFIMHKMKCYEYGRSLCYKSVDKTAIAIWNISLLLRIFLLGIEGQTAGAF
jgi:hypothetical protein